MAERSETGGPETWEGKRGLIAGLAIALAVLVLALAAAGFFFGKRDSLPGQLEKLVQGNLDALYLGKLDPAFLRLSGASEEDCRALHEDGLALEADYFCVFWEIAEPSDSLREELTELYKEIYAQARYTVGEAVLQGEDRCKVPVEVRPLDIMQQAAGRLDAGAMDWFFDKYTEDTVSAMDEAAFQAYDAEWAQGIAALVREALAEPGYLEPETVELELRLTDGSWSLPDEGMKELDQLLIFYPDLS